MKNLHLFNHAKNGSGLKKNVVLFSILLAVLLSLSGCASSGNAGDSKKKAPKNATYRAEFGLVENSVYENSLEMIANYGDEITKKDVKKVRDYLYSNNNFELYDNSIKGITAYDYYEFLVEQGFSSAEAEQEADFLEYLGSSVAYFFYVDSDDYKVWMYIEEE